MTLGLLHEVSCGWSWGRCPKVPLEQNFLLNDYAGVWYERARDKSIWYESGDCVEAKYTKKSGQSFEIRNSQRKPGESTIKPAKRAA